MDETAADETAVLSLATEEGEVTVHVNPQCTGKANRSTEIWASPRVVSEYDKRATRHLIQIVGTAEIQELLNDPKTKMKNVWKQVADQLREGGFNLNMESGGEKCHQKWRNLKRTFKDYMLQLGGNGGGKRKVPEYFHELFEILGTTHIIKSEPASEENESASTHQACDSSNRNEPSLAVTGNSEGLSDNAAASFHNTRSPSVKSFASVRQRNNIGFTTQSLSSVVVKRNPPKKKVKLDVCEVLEQFRKDELKREKERERKETERFEILTQMLQCHHTERLQATYALIEALKGSAKM